MEAAGFEPEDYADDFYEVWPENWAAYLAFSSIGNQWRLAMGGPIALDYGVLFRRLDRLKLDDDDYEQLFDDVKALESGALGAYHQKK